MSDWLLTPLLIKADLIWAATDPDDRQHLLGAVPTGYGKSLPMLVAALLLPPGSTTIIIPPLTVIERQLQEDCLKYGIEVLVGSQVGSEFRASSNSYSPNCMDRLLENMKSRQFANPTKILAQIQLKMSALSERTNWGRSWTCSGSQLD